MPVSKSMSNGFSPQDVSTQRTRRKPGENRELLLEAGIFVFAEQGYHSSTTGAIAQLAGIPQPHVYANFRNKQDLFLACCRQIVTTLGGDGAPKTSKITIAKFVVQMIAASSETKLQPTLSTHLSAIHTLMGRKSFMSLIELAAISAITPAATNEAEA